LDVSIFGDKLIPLVLPIDTTIACPFAYPYS